MKWNWKKMVLVFAVVLFVAIQLVPVDRSNPPVEADLEAPEAVTAVLRTACYDCHSNETHWPWYSYVAPVSWLVAHDVEEARSEFSFSRWEKLGEHEQAECKRARGTEQAVRSQPHAQHGDPKQERAQAESRGGKRWWSVLGWRLAHEPVGSHSTRPEVTQ